MLWCKPGTFMMGSPEDEKGRTMGRVETQHEVTLTKGFYLGKYEVTQEQWEKVMGTNPSLSKGATLPVEMVSWDDAMEFCEGWVYTLATEAQLEYACRAGTTTTYAFGDTITPEQANISSDTKPRTKVVGTYPANAWGLHDMHGNVWEWCSDWYADYPSGSARDPVGQLVGTHRVYRGGSWGSISYFGSMRSARRNRLTPAYRSNILGFRLSLQTAKTE